MNLQEQLNGMNPKERRSFLADNSYKVENGNYLKKLTEDELALKKDEFSSEAIKLADKEDSFSNLKKEWSSDIKELKSEQKKKLTTIRQKGEWKTGDTFLCDDQSEGQMYVFDEEGDLIEKRKLRPDEKQLSLMSKVK